MHLKTNLKKTMNQPNICLLLINGTIPQDARGQATMKLHVIYAFLSYIICIYIK